MKEKVIAYKTEKGLVKSDETLSQYNKSIINQIVIKILHRIENEYNLNYGETLIDPRAFYNLVEDYLQK